MRGADGAGLGPPGVPVDLCSEAPDVSLREMLGEKQTHLQALHVQTGNKLSETWEQRIKKSPHMCPDHPLGLCPFQRNTTTASRCLLSCLSPQFVTSLLFLVAISALGLTLGEDYGPTEGTPSPTKNPTVFYANPVLFAVTWVNTAAVISISSAAPGGITYCALWCLPVRSLCCCARRGWGGGNEPWTLPRSSFSGSSLLCVRYSLSSPSYGRRSARYEIKYHFSCRITYLDAFSLSNHLKYPLCHLWPSGGDRSAPSILPFLHRLWAGGDRSDPLCCGRHPTKWKGACKKGTWELILFHY